MTTLVDTSGLLAVLDSDDAGHARAARAWADLLRADEQLVTSSSILVEVYALTQRRLGMEAVRVLATDFEPLLDVVWGIEADITTRTVDTHVKRLREKLGAAGVYIETVRGVGYRFAGSPDEGGQ